MTEHDDRPEPFVWSSILSRFDGDLDLIRELCQLYREQSAGQLNRLEAALARREIGEVAEIAHSLRGAASNFDSHELVSLLRRIESDARAGALDGDMVRLNELRRCVDQVLERLDREIHALSGRTSNFP